MRCGISRHPFTLCLTYDSCLSPVISQSTAAIGTLLSIHAVPDLPLREMGQDPAGAPAAIGINNHPVQALCEHWASPLLRVSLRSCELGPCSVWLLLLCPYPQWTPPCPVSGLCAQAVWLCFKNCAWKAGIYQSACTY